MAVLTISAASANTVESGCAVDSACGTDPTTKSPDAGEPWDYYSCNPAAQRCNA